MVVWFPSKSALKIDKISIEAKQKVEIRDLNESEFSWNESLPLETSSAENSPMLRFSLIQPSQVRNILFRLFDKNFLNSSYVSARKGASMFLVLLLLLFPLFFPDFVTPSSSELFVDFSELFVDFSELFVDFTELFVLFVLISFSSSTSASFMSSLILYNSD